MISVTLLISTRRSRPATSTPKLKAVRIVISTPNSTKAMKIDRRVNVVRNLRRQMFFQTSGMNFIFFPLAAGARSPRRHRLRVDQHALLEMQRPPRPIGGARIVRDHDNRLAVIAIQRLQEIEDLVAGLAIQIAG